LEISNGLGLEHWSLAWVWGNALWLAIIRSNLKLLQSCIDPPLA